MASRSIRKARGGKAFKCEHPAKSGILVGDEIPAECGLDFSEGRLSRLDELPRQFIGVHDLCPALTQELRGGGFAHAHTPGQTANLHWFLEINTLRPRYGAVEAIRMTRRV